MPRRRASRRSIFGDRITPVDTELRNLILIRDGKQCGYCGTTTAAAWHIDHIVPVKYGGATNYTNLTVACAECNRRKGAELAAFWCRLLVRSGAEVPARRAAWLLSNYFDR